MGDAARSPRKRLRVLLVEDAADIREVFTLLLRAEDVDVVSAASGHEAIDLAARHEFDFVLTDLGLPDIPGDVVIRRVLATSRRRPRILVVTGYDEPFVSRARQAGAEAVFIKPIVWSSLVRMLKSGRERAHDVAA